jgi:hypothetical protein
MNNIVQIVMIGSIFVFFILFAFLPKRRAVLVSLLGAWLFLPVATIEIEGFFDIDKLFLTCAAVFAAILVFDFKRVIRFRPHWADLPMLIWCLVPIASSVSNCLVEGFGSACFNPLVDATTSQLGYRIGFYDGLSEALEQTIKWGLPYFIGRLYFTDWETFKEMAVAFLLAGLVYLPFMGFEMRMSPQLHNSIYGFHQHLFAQTFRFGGWRPMVFMDHGLMLAFWTMALGVMSAWMWWSGNKVLSLPVWFLGAIAGIVVGLVAALSQLEQYAETNTFLFFIPALGWLILLGWLTWSGKAKQSIDAPFWIIAGIFVITTILTRSVNAWVFLGVSLLILFLTEKLKTRVVLVGFMILIPLYTFTQGMGLWPTDTAVDFVTGLIGPDRAQSLEFRYFNEEFLTDKAQQQWLFGWAGWDRQLVTFEWSEARTVPDGLWIIVFGKFGIVGLLSLILSIFTPTFLLLYRYPPWLWAHPKVAPAAALSVILVMYMTDGLLNAMINPLYMLAGGGLVSIFVLAPVAQTMRAKQPSPKLETVSVTS